VGEAGACGRNDVHRPALRTIARPARMGGLQAILTTLQERGAWIATRREIAQHF
jgi:hypothetical protein